MKIILARLLMGLVCAFAGAAASAQSMPIFHCEAERTFQIDYAGLLSTVRNLVDDEAKTKCSSRGPEVINEVNACMQGKKCPDGSDPTWKTSYEFNLQCQLVESVDTAGYVGTGIDTYEHHIATYSMKRSMDANCDAATLPTGSGGIPTGCLCRCGGPGGAMIGMGSGMWSNFTPGPTAPKSCIDEYSGKACTATGMSGPVSGTVAECK